MKNFVSSAARCAVILAAVVATAGCGQPQTVTPEAEVEALRAELKRTQDSLHASEKELQALRKTSSQIRYVEDGPSLAPEPDLPPVNPDEAGREGHSNDEPANPAPSPSPGV